MDKFKIEIKYREDYEDYELWQHILNVPKDILFPVKYSNLIWTDRNLKLITDRAIKQLNVTYHQINFTGK